MFCVADSRPESLETLRVYPLADLHIGAAECNTGEIYNVISKVAGDPNALVILNGDIMDTATRNSVSDIYGATLSPLKQIETAAEMLYPIKDRIIAATCGNHEGRIYKTDGVDTMRFLCRELQCENVYNPHGVLTFLSFGRGATHGKTRAPSKMLYTIYVTHGAGGGKKEGSKINRLADLAGIVDADIYIHSHTHLPAAFKESYFRTDLLNKTAVESVKTFVNTSAALDYGGYGQAQGYKPATVVFPVIELNGRKKSVNVII